MAQSLPPSTDAAVTSKRILVVEDNEDGAVTLGELLASLGHNVEICRDGYQALVKAREFRPDAVFCDIGLPGMTGYDVADALRREPELKSARLIALTGYASDDTERKASDAGFDARLLKPATLDDLRRVGGCVAPAAVQELKRRRGAKASVILCEDWIAGIKALPLYPQMPTLPMRALHSRRGLLRRRVIQNAGLMIRSLMAKQLADRTIA